jgi:hypothetical protein
MAPIESISRRYALQPLVELERSKGDLRSAHDHVGCSFKDATIDEDYLVSLG